MDRKGIVSTYAAALEARGCKQSTIQVRTWQLSSLLDRLQARGLTADPRHIGEREIRAVAGADGLKESTAYSYVRLLSDVCGLFGNDKPNEVRLLWNKTEAEVCWIDTAGLRRMMERAGPTERIVLILGAMAGLRAGEMVNLRLGDLHRDTITVTGKGHGRGKIVNQPIPPTVRAELDRYLRWRERQRVRDDTFLVWTGGRVYTGPSARVMLYNHIRELGQSVGITVTPHSLRRLYATTLVSAGTDILTVSRLMRHNSTETTLKYIQQDRAREYAAAGVLAGIYGI